MPQLEVLVDSESHWMGVCGPILVVFWNRGVEPGVCLRIPEILRSQVRRQRVEKFAVVSVALPGTTAPTSEARQALTRLMRETEEHLSRVAVVYEGQGFIASVVSSVVTGIRMLSGAKVEHKTFNDLGAAVRWAAAELGDELGGQVVLNGIVGHVMRQRSRLSLPASA